MLKKNLVIGQFSFFRLFIGRHQSANLIMTLVSYVKTTESYKVSLGTIKQKTSYDFGILHQDYINLLESGFKTHVEEKKHENWILIISHHTLLRFFNQVTKLGHEILATAIYAEVFLVDYNYITITMSG